MNHWHPSKGLVSDKLNVLKISTSILAKELRSSFKAAPGMNGSGRGAYNLFFKKFISHGSTDWYVQKQGAYMVR
jgi:hypothetical protein